MEGSSLKREEQGLELSTFALSCLSEVVKDIAEVVLSFWCACILERALVIKPFSWEMGVLMRSNNLRMAFFRWIHPLRSFWKPLSWLWGIILSGIGLTNGSQWLLSQNFKLNGTLLGWLVGHPGMTLLLFIPLLLLTGLARLAQDQRETPGVEAEQPVTLSSQQRLQVIRSLQQEYGNRLAHSLQGRVALELGLRERTDVIASSAQLVFRAVDTITEYPVAPGTSITQLYDQAQRGLLILGAPGSGKTTLLLDLVLELLSRAENNLDHPIPIILNFSSWATKKLALSEWLSVQLSLVYGIPKLVGSSWIAKDRVVFLLDGLDEMEASARSMCIEAINVYRRAHLVPLVVCSRSREYEDQRERLNLPDAVEIQPLEPARVTTYLKQAGRLLAAVRTVVQSNTALKQLLTTPLMLNMVILTYQGKAVKDLPHQGPLHDQQRQIFSHYVQHMLERHQKCGTPSEARLLCQLTWLAQQMQHHHLVDFHLEHLQPTWLATKQMRIVYHLLYGLLLGLFTGLLVGLATELSVGFQAVLGGLFPGLTAGLVVGLVAGLRFGPFRGLLVGVIVGPLIGLIFGKLYSLTGEKDAELSSLVPLVGLLEGLFLGLLTGLLIERSENKLAEKVTWSWKGSRKGMLLGLPSGLLTGLISILALLLLYRGSIYIWVYGLTFWGLLFALVFGLILGLFGGLSSTVMNPDLHRRPEQGIRVSGRNAVRFGLVFFLIFGLIAGLIYGLIYRQLLTGLIFGLAYGLPGGLFGSLFGGGMKYLQYYILRFLLWRSGVLPWHAVPFLEEATACILLQRVGGGYRFIHPLLQEYVASLAASPTAPSFPASKENPASP